MNDDSDRKPGFITTLFAAIFGLALAAVLTAAAWVASFFTRDRS